MSATDRKMYLVVTAEMPVELGHAFVQYVRSFDAANSGCHFDMHAVAPEATTDEMAKIIEVEPRFKFKGVFRK